jgi:cell division protein FtsW
MSSATLTAGAAPAWPAFDNTLVLLATALMLIGLVAISSAAIPVATLNYADPWFHAKRHVIYLVAAVTSAALVFSVPLRVWLQSGWLVLFAALVLLLLVLIPGIGLDVKGSQRWLSLGGFTLQPSEFAKLALVVYLAGYLVRREHEVRNQWRGFINPMVVLFAVTLLLMVEPDFGATVIAVGTAFGMLFLAGVRLGHFLLVLLGSLSAMVILLISEQYRVKRLLAYTDPWSDPYGAGFQVIQSLIAFGRGEWFGVGLGNSVQKLFYLPEAHNDFVISIWAEETGFVGVMLVIGLYVALIGRILWLGRRATGAGMHFGGHLCYGVALVFAGQAIINIGVSSGLLPTKGLTLPLISYGGSSLIACCCMLALVLRTHHELHAATPGVRL